MRVNPRSNDSRHRVRTFVHPFIIPSNLLTPPRLLDNKGPQWMLRAQVGDREALELLLKSVLPSLRRYLGAEVLNATISCRT